MWSLGDLNLAGVDFLLDVLGGLAFDIAAYGESSAEDLLDGANEVSSVGLGAHDLGDLADLVHGELASVGNVLHLLSVTRRRLESLEDENGGGVDDADLALLVLDLHFDGNLHALVALGCLHDVLTDLLGRDTEGTELGGASSRGGSFLTDDLHLDVVDGKRVKLSFGRHSILFLSIY